MDYYVVILCCCQVTLLNELEKSIVNMILTILIPDSRIFRIPISLQQPKLNWSLPKSLEGFPYTHRPIPSVGLGVYSLCCPLLYGDEIFVAAINKTKYFRLRLSSQN